MPSNVVKISVSIDADLLGPAKKRAEAYQSRFKKENLSAYVSDLIKQDVEKHRAQEKSAISSGEEVEKAAMELALSAVDLAKKGSKRPKT